MEVTHKMSLYVAVRIKNEYRALRVQVEKSENSSYAMVQIEQLLN